MRYLAISLLIHGLVLIFSGTTFIGHVQYSVRPSAAMVEISIEEMKDSKAVSPVSLGGALLISRSLIKKYFKNRNTAISSSGVRVKANPDYFQNPSPEYPELAWQLRQEGVVMLSVDVDRTGEPVKVEIIQSSGFHLLDQAAVRAVSHWKFQPGNIGGITVDSTATIPIRFRLEK